MKPYAGDFYCPKSLRVSAAGSHNCGVGEKGSLSGPVCSRLIKKPNFCQFLEPRWSATHNLQVLFYTI